MKLKRIRDLREDNDLTQADIAKYLNVTQRTYSRYENDDRSIPLEQLIKLADYYKITLDELLNHVPVKRKDRACSTNAAPEPRLLLEEQQLIHRYRQLNPTRQSALRDFVNYLYIQEQQDRKEQAGA